MLGVVELGPCLDGREPKGGGCSAVESDRAGKEHPKTLRAFAVGEAEPELEVGVEPDLAEQRSSVGEVSM